MESQAVFQAKSQVKKFSVESPPCILSVWHHEMQHLCVRVIVKPFFGTVQEFVFPLHVVLLVPEIYVVAKVVVVGEVVGSHPVTEHLSRPRLETPDVQNRDGSGEIHVRLGQSVVHDEASLWGSIQLNY